jgi:hypothetical protein
VRFFAVLVAFVSAFIGQHRSERINVTNKSNPFVIEGVSRDGWIRREAIVDIEPILKDLGERAIVKLSLDGWRPSGKPDVLVKVCGNEQARSSRELNFEFRIDKNSCSDKAIRIEVKNPFKSPDKRELGVKFVSVDFKSDWSLELFNELSFWVAAIFCLALSILWGGKSFLIFGPSTVFLLQYIHWDSAFDLLTLGIVILFISCGFKIDILGSPRDLKGYKLPLALILILALGIRLYGFDFGLPHFYHPDEFRKAQIAFRIVEEGRFDPRYFLHPSLLLYLTALMGGIRELFFGAESSVVMFTESGRLVSIIANTLSVFLVYRLGILLFSNRLLSVIAASLVAFSPLMITSARYLKEDSLLTFFVLLATYFSARASKNRSSKTLLLAGLCVGLAAGSKYSGVLAAIALFVFPLIYWRLTPVILLSCLLIPVGFLVTTPYSVLNSEQFVSDFNKERKHMHKGHDQMKISPWDHFWMYHAGRSVAPSLGWITFLVVLIVTGDALRRRDYTVLALIVLAGTFYMPAEFVNAKPPPQPERYIFPCIPFLALVAAYGFIRLKPVIWVAAVASIAIPSLLLAREIPNDTRKVMRHWMVHNLQGGSHVLIDAIPYTPQLPEFRTTLFGAPEQRRNLTIDKIKEIGAEYVLVTSLSYDRFFHTRTSDQIVRRRFEEIFSGLTLVHEVRPKYKTYGFHNPTLKLFKVE